MSFQDKKTNISIVKAITTNMAATPSKRRGVVGSDSDVTAVIDHGLRLAMPAMDLNRINGSLLKT